MPMHNSEQYIRSVLAYVKFGYDHQSIRGELESHMEERIEGYMEDGYSREEAEKITVEGMGDAREVGKLLNKEHHPLIGRIWLASRFAVAGASVILGFILIFNIGALIDNIMDNPVGQINEEDIIYKIKVNEKVKIDDRVIVFTDVIYEKDHTINIIYTSYDTRLWGMGWSDSGVGKILDEKGNEYFTGSGGGGGGIISKGIKSKRNFPQDAKMLIVDYDYYNRNYRVEIPLEKGVSNE